MAYQIITKKRFENKLVKLLEYLENEWGKKVADEFASKLITKLDILALQPYIGSTPEGFKNVRAILISKHNKLYYKVGNSKIIVLNMYDTRINPVKNPYKR